MSGPAPVADVEWALHEVSKGLDVDPKAARFLIGIDSSTVESSLLAMLAGDDTSFEVAALASRILVERDPARDPAFIYQYFPDFARSVKDESITAKVTARFSVYPPPGAHQFGFARLRRLEPVSLYAEQLDHRFLLARLGAAAALGDTADLGALEPLSRALGDRSWRVRMNAADSVRRLRHVGAGDVLAAHPVRDGLIRCLSDGRHKVRVAAARALGSMGDLEPVRERRARSLRSRREFGRVLRGEIPPLPKIWPCDNTV